MSEKKASNRETLAVILGLGSPMFWALMWFSLGVPGLLGIIFAPLGSLAGLALLKPKSMLIDGFGAFLYSEGMMLATMGYVAPREYIFSVEILVPFAISCIPVWIYYSKIVPLLDPERVPKSSVN